MANWTAGLGIYEKNMLIIACYPASVLFFVLVVCWKLQMIPDVSLFIFVWSPSIPCVNSCPLAGITLSDVETTCSRLLAQAGEAEKEGYTETQAEKMILEEFGQCLTQIVQSIFKSGSFQA